MKRSDIRKKTGYLLSVFLRPVNAVRHPKPDYSSALFILPMATWLLFVIQQSLDKAYLDLDITTDAVMRCFGGFCAGGICSFIAAALLFFFGRCKENDITLSQICYLVNLTWFFPLILNAFGLIVDLIFSVHTAVVFGISGILFSLLPLYEIGCLLFSEKEKGNLLSVCFMTVSGILYLLGAGLLFMII